DRDDHDDVQDRSLRRDRHLFTHHHLPTRRIPHTGDDAQGKTLSLLSPPLCHHSVHPWRVLWVFDRGSESPPFSVQLEQQFNQLGAGRQRDSLVFHGTDDRARLGVPVTGDYVYRRQDWYFHGPTDASWSEVCVPYPARGGRDH